MEAPASTRPRSLIIGVTLFAIPLGAALVALFFQRTFHPSWVLLIAFVFVPAFFALYRLYIGDAIARAVVTITVVTAIGFGSYAAYVSYTFEVPQQLRDLAAEGSGSLRVVGAVELAERSQASAAYTAAIVIWLALGLVSIYLPRSTRWIRHHRAD